MQDATVVDGIEDITDTLDQFVVGKSTETLSTNQYNL